MDKLLIKTLDGITAPKVLQSFDTVELYYPCVSQSECTQYSFNLTSGIYIFEAYGASGGELKTTSSMKMENGTCVAPEKIAEFRGNAKCFKNVSAGAGGYVSGVLTLYKTTEIIATIGGAGHTITTNDVKGGYNGGGCGILYKQSPGTSGGGATDIRIGGNDLWHRIMVAGGGGGRDDENLGPNPINDGHGGCGGYPSGQGYWVDSQYNGSRLATQEYGFSFGQGEAPLTLATPHVNSTTYECKYDCAGGGGGWFGGHASRRTDSGAGGGSSFALTKDAIIPREEIEAHDELHNLIGKKKYAYLYNCKYCMEDVQFANGIWAGSGLVRIRKIPLIGTIKACISQTNLFDFQFTLLGFLVLNK